MPHTSFLRLVRSCLVPAIAILLFILPIFGQTTINTPPTIIPKLLGSCSKDSLMKEPYNQWFEKNYNDYHPNPEVMSRLKKINLDDYSFKIFFGSWCGDSKREVPRMFNIFDQLTISKKSIELIAVDDEDSVYKQSPGHEESGFEVYRVPTCFVYKKGKEVGRFNEFPVESLERDFLTIFSGAPYTPNYYSYPYIRKWLNDGILSDTNVSYRGLANQIRNLVMNRSELTSCGYVLLERGQQKEGLTIFRIATYLFPDEPGTHRALAEGLFAIGEKENAITEIEKALEINKDPAQIKPIMEQRDKIKK